MDLAEFLLARYAEEEALLRDAVHIGCVEDVSDGPDTMHGVRCPRRLLAGCEAKRRIVESFGGGEPLTLRLLALPYVDHEQYHPAWSVEARV